MQACSHGCAGCPCGGGAHVLRAVSRLPDLSRHDPGDPACRYTRMLEAGHRPDVAYASAFGQAAAGNQKRGRPALECNSPAPPTDPFTTADGVSAELISSTYMETFWTHVYELSFNSTAGVACRTWLRINIPCWPQRPDIVPVVIGVEGGTKSDMGVRFDRTAEPMWNQVLYLTSGESSLVLHSSEETPEFHVRDSEPMITATFSQPGRGQAGDGEGDGEEEEEGKIGRATGNPAFLARPTPENTTGQDYCGEMALDMMNAACGVVQTIVAEFLDDPSNLLAGLSDRWVVMSYSNGLTLASAWIAQTCRRVHALVDVEGPTDGQEQTHAVWWTNPFELDESTIETEKLADERDEDGQAWFVSSDVARFPTNLSWSWWSGMWVDDADLFYFRPPIEAMDGYVATPKPILTGFRDNEKYADYADQWAAYYLHGGPVLLRTTLSFWRDRQALAHLSFLLTRQVAYVRVQGLFDHGYYPSYLKWQKATKALQAAYEGRPGKSHPNCYYTDNATYFVGHTSARATSAVPARWTGAWTPSDPYTDWPAWPDRLNYSWILQIDLVRWAMDEAFAW